MKFTENTIKGLKAKEASYRIAEKGSDKGFGIKVTPAGAKTFFLQYAANGKRRFLNLGRYPSITLSEARENCRKQRAIIDGGIDPQATPTIKDGTVNDLFSYYIEQMIAAGKKTADKVKRDLEFNSQEILSLPANSIEPHHIKQLLFNIIERGSTVQSNRIRSYLHRAFDIGIHHDNDPQNMGKKLMFNIKVNPVASVPKNAAAESVGERALSFDEIKILWHTEQLPEQFLLTARLLLIYGCRSWELMGAEKSEFDFENAAWTIPPERVKNKRFLVLPLTPLAYETLSALWVHSRGSKFLYPNRYDDLKQIGKTSFQHSVDKITSMTRFVPRDLRRTCKTRMGEIGIDKAIRDRLQNHALTDVSSKHYDRWDYLPEKRAALLLWEAAIIEYCDIQKT